MKREDMKKGMAVLAFHPDYEDYYEATIAAFIKGKDKARVEWDDGDDPIVVPFKQIKARPVKVKRKLPESLKAREVKGPMVAVIGINANGGYHAAKFNADEKKGLEKAVKKAKGSGWMVIEPTAENKALMKTLPNGKLHDTGGIFCPFTKGEKYEALSGIKPKKAKGGKSNAKAEKAPVKPAKKADKAKAKPGKTTATKKPVKKATKPAAKPAKKKGKK